jgi:protein involved in polysaccharide export with SLBB domain
MMRMSRRKKIASVVMLGVFLGLAGCASTGDDRLPLQSPPAGTNARGSYPGYPNGPNYPVQMPSGPVDTTSYSSRPRLTVQAAQPGEEIIGEQNLGMPQQMMPNTGGAPMMSGPMTNGQIMSSPMMGNGGMPLPTELNKTAHAPHRVAAPDILYIEALRMVPRGPYRLEPMEVLQIEATDSLRGQPIKGLYMISPEGKINLGYSYQPIQIGGLTIDEAQRNIKDYLAKLIIPFKDGTASVSVTLVQMRGMQNVKGEHLVRPDGTISLGMYGSVFVAGMNLGQVKCTIENHLAAYLINPQVSVDVFAYNSRKIYIIADGAGYGQQVIALPATGNETVLDAISKVAGLPAVSSCHKIWVARPAPAGHACSQILPVDWTAITQAGQTTTNYQLLPGDRIYISSNAFIRAYNYIDMAIAPVERIFGVLFLGSSTFNSFRNSGTTTGVVVR